MKKILILEDSEERKAWFRKQLDDDDTKYFIVDTVEHAIDLLQEHSFDYAYLDHDLLPAYQTFYSQHSALRLVKYIVKYTPNIGFITIHSINRAASNEMAKQLDNAGYEVNQIPFYKLREQGHL